MSSAPTENRLSVLSSQVSAELIEEDGPSTMTLSLSTVHWKHQVKVHKHENIQNRSNYSSPGNEPMEIYPNS